MTTIKIKKLEFKKLYDIACSNWKTKFNEKLNFFTSSDSFEFEKSFLQEMKQACTETQKPIFNKIFGKYLKEEIDLFKVKTYKEVCRKLKEKELVLSDFNFLDSIYRKKALSQAKLQQIEKFFNQNWTKDWKNQNQYKYYPYFSINASGLLGFSASSCHVSLSRGEVFFYKDKVTSDYVGKTFIDLYQDLQ